MAEEESEVEMLKDPKKVLHVLMPLELGDNGSQKHLGNSQSTGDLDLILIITGGEDTPNRETVQQPDSGVKSSTGWLRCLGYMGNILKFPVSPGAALGGDQKGLGDLQKGGHQQL